MYVTILYIVRTYIRTLFGGSEMLITGSSEFKKQFYPFPLNELLAVYPSCSSR